MTETKHKPVSLKSDPELTGQLGSLYLPADLGHFRKYDSWFINWDNGKTGICEESDLIFTYDK